MQNTFDEILSKRDMEDGTLQTAMPFYNLLLADLFLFKNQEALNVLKNNRRVGGLCRMMM